jgi:hypothetical protein
MVRIVFGVIKLRLLDILWFSCGLNVSQRLNEYNIVIIVVRLVWSYELSAQSH